MRNVELASSISSAWRMVSQSDWLPMMTPTSGRASDMPHISSRIVEARWTQRARRCFGAWCSMSDLEFGTPSGCGRSVRAAGRRSRSDRPRIDRGVESGHERAACFCSCSRQRPRRRPPRRRPAPKPIELPYTQFTLPNGLHVILHEDHSVPVVTVNVWYHVGSARELPGRTGFAHLFEHLMFMGSGHVKPGEFDTWLEGAGGTEQRLHRQRPDQLLDQRAGERARARVVSRVRSHGLSARVDDAGNRRRPARCREERAAPVGREPAVRHGRVVLGEMLYPQGHPYHWPVIGYMEDLTAASYDDVVAFFKKYYGPANASLVVAGDIDPATARTLVEKWFSDVKPGEPVDADQHSGRGADRRAEKDDYRPVQLSRLYMAWLTPMKFAPGDAALDLVADVLAGSKNSRLYKRLVYDMQIAQSVAAFQNSQALSSYFVIEATPRPGHTVDELQKVIDEEIVKLQHEPPTDHEVQRALNQIESSFYSRMERVGGFGGKADQLNGYFVSTGDPDWFNEDLGRYRAISPSDVRAAADAFLPAGRRVELTVDPKKRAATHSPSSDRRTQDLGHKNTTTRISGFSCIPVQPKTPLRDPQRFSCFRVFVA